MKKILSVLLALVLCLTILPGAQADYYDYTHDYYSSEVYLYGETSLYGTSYAGISNIRKAVEAIDGLTLSPWDWFSFNATVGPRTEQYGYRKALNGRGVSVIGGGVAQVAATIYQAILYDTRFPVGQLTTYGDRYTGSYVGSGDEAVVTDYKAGTDFTFRNDSGEDVVINVWVDEEARLVCCTISSEYYSSEDLIGYAETPLYGSANKLANIDRCAYAITGVTLAPYEAFSFNGIVGPRTEQNGYKKAVNGRGVNVIGGGVAQVASTIYLAIKHLDCVEVLDMHTYGANFSDGYVTDNRDAVVTDYNAGTDFSFWYTCDRYLRVDIYAEGDTLVCCIYETDY